MLVPSKTVRELELKLEAYDAVEQERWRGHSSAFTDFKKYAESRWENLNGEAGRLKTAADLSVTREKFDDYVNTQRKSFDEYKETQARAFKLYADEMSAWRSALSARIAMWTGGGIVLLAMLQFYFKYAN